MVVARLANAFFCWSRSRYFSGMVAMAWFLAAADFSDRDRLWHLSGLSGNFSANSKPHRLCDKRHSQFGAAQPCLVCGRKPSDAYQLRFAQSRHLEERRAMN